jgi:hypothetical protein
MMLRGLVVWLVIIAVETVHGIARTLWVEPLVGALRARQIAVFTGSMLILTIASLFVRWLGATSRRELVHVGLSWLVLTLAFEIALGRALGASWDRIASDYDPRRGGLLLLGMVVLATAPLLARWIRSSMAPPESSR